MINRALIDLIDRAYKAGAISANDLNTLQDPAYPLCAHCHTRHARALEGDEQTPICPACFIKRYHPEEVTP